MSDSTVSSEIPSVPSPYAGKRITNGQHLTISAYWFATNFLWGALLTIMLPDEVKHLVPAYKAAGLGILTAISAVVALITPLVVGALSDRCASPMGRRRPYMLVGLVVNAIGLGFMAFVNHVAPSLPITEQSGNAFQAVLGHMPFVAFLAAYMVVQLGNNISSAAYSGVIPDLIPEDQRGAASGYMALMSQLGTLFGAVGCGMALGGASELIKYGLVLVVLVLVGMITITGIKETPLPAKPPKIEWGAYVKSLWIDPKQHPDFAWVWITRALVMLGFYAILPFINYFLADVTMSKHPGTDAAILIGIILIASSISGIYGGHLSDRIGRKRVVYLANTMIAVTALLFILCHTLVHVAIVGVVFGLGFGAYTSVDWALGTDVLPSKDHAAKEMAVWHIAMTLPQSFAAPIASILISQPGSTKSMEGGELVMHYTHQGYALVFIMASICFGLGAYFLRNVRGVK